MPLVREEKIIEVARCDCREIDEFHDHIHSKPCLEKAFYQSDYSGEYYCYDCAAFQTEGYFDGFTYLY